MNIKESNVFQCRDEECNAVFQITFDEGQSEDKVECRPFCMGTDINYAQHDTEEEVNQYLMKGIKKYKKLADAHYKQMLQMENKANQLEIEVESLKRKLQQQKIYVVLYEDSEDKHIAVLDVYTDEDKANSRVGFERGMTDEKIWYQEANLK